MQQVVISKHGIIYVKAMNVMALQRGDHLEQIKVLKGGKREMTNPFQRGKEMAKYLFNLFVSYFVVTANIINKRRDTISFKKKQD